MKIFVGAIHQLITWMRSISSRAKMIFDIPITSASLGSNCCLFFGAGSYFAQAAPTAAAEIESNLGLFYVTEYAAS